MKTRRLVACYVTLVLAIGLVACRHETDAADGAKRTFNPLARKSHYVGDWVNIEKTRERLSIRPEGEAFVIEDEQQKKFVGTMVGGVLRVSGPLGTIDILHTSSNDHLIAAGKEFRRMDVASSTGGGDAVVSLNPSAAARETMSRMRTIATAWEARATDTNSYAVDGAIIDVSADALRNVLSPTYIRELPTKDAWNNAFQFTVSQDGNSYSIRSLGENGRRDETPPGVSDAWDADIVFTEGRFVSYPGGAQ